jgi:hypothetical protein
VVRSVETDGAEACSPAACGMLAAHGIPPYDIGTSHVQRGRLLGFCESVLSALSAVLCSLACLRGSTLLVACVQLT